MGHYDNCREAQEEIERERDGRFFKRDVAALDDKSAGILRDVLIDVGEASSVIAVNREHHQLLDRFRTELRKIGLW